MVTSGYSGDPGQRSTGFGADAPRPTGLGADTPGIKPASGVSAGNIFGWSWLGRWADENANAPARAQTFIKSWVKKFNSRVLEGIDDPYVEEVFIQDFLADLNRQTWWSEQTAVWQAVQKLRYDPTTPAGEYERLITDTQRYIADYARMQGYGGVVPDRSWVENLILTGSDVGSNGLPVLNADEANRQIENFIFGSEDEFDPDQIGPGSLQDLFDNFKRIATQNYVSITDSDIWDLVEGVKTEKINWQTGYDDIVRRVGDQYGFLAGSTILDRINSFSYNNQTDTFGHSSLNSHLTPVRDTLADIWDLDSSEIRLQDVFGKQLQDLVVREEGEDERFMNSREVSRWARTQPQFEKTEAYKVGMGNLTGSLLQLFGAR